jgi:hypothetical protein
MGDFLICRLISTAAKNHPRRPVFSAGLLAGMVLSIAFRDPCGRSAAGMNLVHIKLISYPAAKWPGSRKMLEMI